MRKFFVSLLLFIGLSVQAQTLDKDSYNGPFSWDKYRLFTKEFIADSLTVDRRRTDSLLAIIQTGIDSLKSVNTFEVGSNKEYSTIQEAIDSASSDNKINVSGDQDYTENLTIDKKLKIYSEDGANIYGKVIISDTVTLQNLNIVNMAASTDTVISNRGGKVSMKDCNLSGIVTQTSGVLSIIGNTLEGGTEIYQGTTTLYPDSIKKISSYTNQGLYFRGSSYNKINAKFSNIGIAAYDTSYTRITISDFQSTVGTYDSLAVVEMYSTDQSVNAYCVTKGGTIRGYHGTSYQTGHVDTTTGLHNFEMSEGYASNRIELYDYTIKFSGYDSGGNYQLLGSPVEALEGTFIMRNSTVTNEDGGGKGDGYSTVVKLSTKTKAYITGNTIIYQQDHAGNDGTGVSFGKEDSVAMDVRIVNNVIQTDSNSAFTLGIRESAISGGSLILPYNELLDSTDICDLSNNDWINKGYSTRYINTNISVNLDSLYDAYAYHNIQHQNRITNLRLFGTQNVINGYLYFGTGGMDLVGSGDYALNPFARYLVGDSLHINSNTHNIRTDPYLSSSAILSGGGGVLTMPRKSAATGVGLSIAGRVIPTVDLGSDDRIGLGTNRFLLLNAGNVQTNIRTITADDMYYSSDRTILVDATSDTVSVSNTPAWGTGYIYTLKKIDASANPVILVVSGGKTIDDASTYTLTSQYQFVTYQSDGTNFQIIGSN